MAMQVRPPDPALTDGFVTLRPWGAEGDEVAIAAACNDREIAEFLDLIPSPYTEDDAREFIQRTRYGWSQGTNSVFAILVGGRPVGSLGVHWIEPEQGVAEVGYWVAPEARGRGVCTAAVKLAASWVFEREGMERLQLRADERNLGSTRVAEKAGFTREGVLRSSRYNPRLGRRVDFAVYSLLRREL